MSPSVRPDVRQTLPENIRLDMAKAQTTPNVVVDPRDGAADAAILSLIEAARRRADLKLEYLAALARVKMPTLSGALNGHGSFNVCWLAAWPAEFWDEFLPLLRAEKERSEDARRAQRKERLIRAIETLLTEVA